MKSWILHFRIPPAEAVSLPCGELHRTKLSDGVRPPRIIQALREDPQFSREADPAPCEACDRPESGERSTGQDFAFMNNRSSNSSGAGSGTQPSSNCRKTCRGRFDPLLRLRSDLGATVRYPQRAFFELRASRAPELPRASWWLVSQTSWHRLCRPGTVSSNPAQQMKHPRRQNPSTFLRPPVRVVWNLPTGTTVLNIRPLTHRQ